MNLIYEQIGLTTGDQAISIARPRRAKPDQTWAPNHLDFSSSVIGRFGAGTVTVRVVDFMVA